MSILSRFVTYFAWMWIAKCWTYAEFRSVTDLWQCSITCIFWGKEPHNHEFFRYSKFCGRSDIMSVNTIFVRWNYSFVLWKTFGSLKKCRHNNLSCYFIYWYISISFKQFLCVIQRDVLDIFPSQGTRLTFL